MPPEDAPSRPNPHERRAVIEAIQAVCDREARRNAGDPGPVLARRLSHAEYDHTARDLTGVDLRPTREFPVDPANEAGFDNSGESLTMSPALVRKYLAAARGVADHLILKPDDLGFAPDPAVAETDRDKYCVRRIVDFYARHRVDYADYFVAAWKFRHREALGRPGATLRDFAVEAGLSPTYLATVGTTLAGTWPAAGPLGEVLALWRDPPAPVQDPGAVRRGCERMRDLVVRLRDGSASKVERLRVTGISDGSQPLVLWRNRVIAARRMRPPIEGGARGLEEFCRVFPDASSVSDRPPISTPRERTADAC